MPRVFTRRLVLTTPVRVPDGAGGFVREWRTRGALWAEVRMRSGGLRHGEFGRMPRLQVRIVTHALPEGHVMRPVPGDRLMDRSRALEVEAIHESDRRTMTILASEVPVEEAA